MTPRPLSSLRRSSAVATVLCLGLLAGCSSNPRTPAPENRAESGGTPAAADPAAPKTGGAPMQGEAPSGGSPSADTGKGVVYFVKDSGVRCITMPCPSYIATRADQPDAEGLKVTELDLGALGLNEDQQAKLLDATHDGTRGLKVEASVVKVPNAGPAGEGTRLSVNRVLQGQ